MVQNQVTVLGCNRPKAFRQARPLAEGQKSADVKHDFHNTTPSANPDSWRRGSNSPRDMQIFRLSRYHLAEGVPRRRCHPIDGDFESCRLCHVATRPEMNKTVRPLSCQTWPSEKVSRG